MYFSSTHRCHACFQPISPEGGSSNAVGGGGGGPDYLGTISQTLLNIERHLSALRRLAEDSAVPLAVKVEASDPLCHAGVVNDSVASTPVQRVEGKA